MRRSSRRYASPLWSALMLHAMLGWPSAVCAQHIVYPDTPRGNVIDDYAGQRVPDPYRWLEQLRSPETSRWLRAESMVTTSVLARLPGRTAIRRRLTSLMDSARTDVPWREAGRIFYFANTGLQPQSTLYSQDSWTGPSRKVLDPNEISPDGSTAVRDIAVSPDGKLLAYCSARGGADVSQVHIRGLASGRDLADVVTGVLTSVCWTKDGRGFFYVLRPDSQRNDSAEATVTKRLLYHVIGDPPHKDRTIAEWTADARWVYCMLSEDGRYAAFVAEKGTESEMNVLDLADPMHPNVTAAPFRLLREHHAFHTPVDFVGSTLYVLTNLDAPRRCVIALNLDDGAEAQPRTVIPESDDVMVNAAVAGDRLVVNYLSNVTSRLWLFSFDGSHVGDVPLPGIGSVGWPLGGRGSVAELFYSFTSFLEPSTVYRYDLKTGVTSPFHPPKLTFDPSGYRTTQVFYTSKDGTSVPMFVTAARDLKMDGTHPVFLTAYGGYGATREPAFDPEIPMWLELGGIYVVANIRGGGEFGEEWHRAGMLERKQTSFDDFYAAAEYLIAQRYTAPGRIAIYGHSNGGLLIGAAITQRPELFAAAIANAGHYDMLRYHRFTAGAGWISEYGSPDDPKAFPYLRAYSPLQNVRGGTCYPAVLLLAADHDDRVVPSHAYKFAAALQFAQACDRPILLRVAVDASHSYASRQAVVAEKTDVWAFVASRLGVAVRSTPATLRGR